MRIIVIGAGIFGITIALELAKKHNITLVDMNRDIMQNASKVNHNRLHFGFHYPRSKVTALQSLEGYELFYDYFKDAINSNFENYYMIEKNSNVNNHQYERFCDDLHLIYRKQYPEIDINFDNIEASYLTNEPIFDYGRIRSILESDIENSGIKLILDKNISNKRDVTDYDIIINTTYFNINKIKKIFGLPQTKLRLQTVIIPIFNWNTPPTGLTIMDGKYCSIMPKGFQQEIFLLYHAKESIIYEIEANEIPAIWGCGKKIINNHFIKENIYDKIIAMRHINKILTASKKYFRFLKDCEVMDYWQTIRALPINDDDERLSIFDVSEYNSQKIISVLSGKISTCLLTAQNINKII